MKLRHFTLLAALVLGACKQREDKPLSTVQGPAVPRMTGFYLQHFEGAAVAYGLKAVQADIYEKENNAKLVTPNMTIYEQPAKKNTAKKSQVKAGPVKIEALGERGDVNLNTKDVILEGNVVYRVIKNGYTLRTSKLIYWSSRHETEVPDGTGYTMTTPNGVIEGSGMISKEDLQ